MKSFAQAFLAVCLALGILVLVGCSGSKKGMPRIQPAEGHSLPAVSALAFSSDGRRFVSVSEDGFTREWDILAGLVSVSETGDGTALPGGRPEFPVFSPDGTKKLLPAGDGAVCLVDAATEKELARYYGFGRDEWISIVPDGFYNASFNGSSFLAAEAGTRRYNLDQLSAALFRPDLFAEQVSESMVPKNRKSETPPTLESLFEDALLPPLLSVLTGSVSSGEGTGRLTIKITAQKGGAGLLALYRRSAGPAQGGEEIPAGLFDIEKAAEKKYSEKGRTCYEISLGTDQFGIHSGGISFDGISFDGNYSAGISAFNKYNTVESERLWIEIPHAPGPQPALPVLRVLFAAPEDTEALGEFLALQADGDLYSSAEVKGLFGEEFTREDFVQTLEEICKESGQNDTLALYIRGAGRADPLGNLQIFPENAHAAGNMVSFEQLLQPVLGISPDRFLILLDLESGAAPEKLETALLRFRHRLGPRAMLASLGPPDRGYAFVRSVVEGLGQAPTAYGPAENRYTGVSGLLAYAGSASKEQGGFLLAFYPLKDFPIADPFFNAGELKFQTMTSGMLKIDKVDKEPVALGFGNTMIRPLPPGSYIVDMFYRNGYRETRTVELRRKESKWVIFNYTPALFTGANPGRLPSGRINLTELNPANYEKVNREAMEGMGMAPSYVAFLAGEKFYKEGNYDQAIAEYGRAISLKADYADAYASRGNAQRRKGNLDRAIEDYNRALGFKKNYAEVFNYRGFAYAQKGELGRAIADYTQAIRNRAGYADAYFNRAYAYGKQESWDKAIADYTQVIKLEPNNETAYNERGNAWNSKGDAAKAAADFAAAERLKMR